ncbi:hypothetical protein LHJ74_07560 [Streptomyces sp. N2-109]|uniref:Lipoprotein n=1 Tax=Streptomyces gossypii TaxID=2883101 RepID=A0ABT2JPI1_9ACTN|nr:hypothetical protein [Streptomyces gossypii]MCT2589775.1 hypothetical protein [Streptomyces gossypii]
MRPPATGTARLACAAAGVTLLPLLAGCGEQGREFSVPESLCGTKIPAETLDPLLPDEGDSVDVDLNLDNEKFRSCNVGVGRDIVLTASLNRVPEYYDPMSPDGGGDNLEDPRRMRKLPFEGAGVTGSGGGAKATAKCGGSGPAYLYVDLSVVEERAKADADQLRADMRRFSIAFLESSKKREGCAA